MNIVGIVIRLMCVVAVVSVVVVVIVLATRKKPVAGQPNPLGYQGQSGYGYPPNQLGQTGYPPSMPGYPPNQAGQAGYPPSVPGYVPNQPGYPPAEPGPMLPPEASDSTHQHSQPEDPGEGRQPGAM